MQREMPFFRLLENAQWVPDSIVTGWASYHKAVMWCWANRPKNKGKNEPDDQAMFARNAGLHVPHMSRCVNEKTKAPMDFKPDYIPEFEAYTQWRGVTQYLMRNACVTSMEQVMAERRVA